MVSDRDIAAKIREAAPGNTLADVLAAWDLVRARLDSRDDSDTARAFREVLDRYLAPPPGDREAADWVWALSASEIVTKIVCRLYPGATGIMKSKWQSEISMVEAALAAARRDERETGIAEERARWRPDDAPDREPTEFEVGLWERILAGMLEDDKGFVSSAHPAFRAWCLTVIKPYTDAIVKAAREEGRGDAEARVAALGAAGRQLLIEVENHCIINCEGNYERFEIARDELAALVKRKVTEEAEGDGKR